MQKRAKKVGVPCWIQGAPGAPGVQCTIAWIVQCTKYSSTDVGPVFPFLTRRLVDGKVIWIILCVCEFLREIFYLNVRNFYVRFFRHIPNLLKKERYRATLTSIRSFFFLVELWFGRIPWIGVFHGSKHCGREVYWNPVSGENLTPVILISAAMSTLTWSLVKTKTRAWPLHSP